jgi:hypothetical protein
VKEWAVANQYLRRPSLLSLKVFFKSPSGDSRSSRVLAAEAFGKLRLWGLLRGFLRRMDGSDIFFSVFL